MIEFTPNLLKDYILVLLIIAILSGFCYAAATENIEDAFD